jgi:hypothetical protein
MDFRGLAVGAGNVARGYRAAETDLRAAETERLNLQRLNLLFQFGHLRHQIAGAWLCLHFLRQRLKQCVITGDQ